MTLYSPKWLLCLIGVLLFIVFLFWDRKKRKEKFSFFAKEVMWFKIAPELDFSARIKKGLFLSLAFIFFILALARPQWGSHEENIPLTGLDIIVALDVSNSMYVEDQVFSRLKLAKHFIKSMLTRLSGDRVGVVAFAGSSYLACPLTTDLDYVLEIIETLSPESITNQGTQIKTALEISSQALSRAAEDNTLLKEKGIFSKVLILISDGENYEDGAEGIASHLKTEGISFFVFGIGTQNGAPIPIRDEAGFLKGYKKDRQNHTIISKFSPDFLHQLAKNAGGKYWTLSINEAELEEFLAEIKTLSRGNYGEKKYLVYEERYQIPLVLGIIFLLLELSLAMRKTTRLLMFLLFFINSLGNAATPVETYLENEQGVRAYKKGEMEEAKQKFNAAQARDPESLELKYNQSVMEAAQGNLEKAAKGFSEVAEQAKQKRNQNLSEKSFFNLGELHQKKGDVNGALQAYLQGIDTTKQTKNEKLEKDIRKNIELLQMAKKQQQEQNQEQNKEQDKKQKQDQKQSPNKTPNKNDDQKKEDSKNNKNEDKKKDEEPKAKDFKHDKMNKEDAERVMAELAEREKKLHNAKKHVGKQTNLEKDW